MIVIILSLMSIPCAPGSYGHHNNQDIKAITLDYNFIRIKSLTMHINNYK